MKIRHFRNIAYDVNQGFFYHNLGGITMVSEQVGENTFQIGVSICNREDNFCKKLGRRLAVRRLVKNPITLTREELEEIKVETTVYDFYLAAEHILNQKGLTASKAFV